MKTKEELNALKNETGKGVNTMKELENEELEKVAGGAGNTSDNPKGLVPGEKVYFYWGDAGQWMWGTFLYYINGQYRIKWDDTRLIFHGGNFLLVEADEDSIPEEYVRRNAN